jgi:hypothetical protein
MHQTAQHQTDAAVLQYFEGNGPAIVRRIVPARGQVPVCAGTAYYAMAGPACPAGSHTARPVLAWFLHGICMCWLGTGMVSAGTCMASSCPGLISECGLHGICMCRTSAHTRCCSAHGLHAMSLLLPAAERGIPQHMLWGPTGHKAPASPAAAGAAAATAAGRCTTEFLIACCTCAVPAHLPAEPVPLPSAAASKGSENTEPLNTLHTASLAQLSTQSCVAAYEGCSS